MSWLSDFLTDTAGPVGRGWGGGIVDTANRQREDAQRMGRQQQAADLALRNALAVQYLKNQAKTTTASPLDQIIGKTVESPRESAALPATPTTENYGVGEEAMSGAVPKTRTVPASDVLLSTLGFDPKKYVLTPNFNANGTTSWHPQARPGAAGDRTPMGETSAHYGALVKEYIAQGMTEIDARRKAYGEMTESRSERAKAESTGRTLGSNTGEARDAKAETQRAVGKAGAEGGIQGQLTPVPSPVTGSPVPGKQAVTQAQTLGQGLEAGEKKALSDLYATRNLAKRIVDLSGDFTKPYFGPVQGRWSSVAEHWGGTLPGVSPLSEEELMVRRSMADAKDALLRARSGAQINEQEYKRLANLLPGPELPPETARARMKDFLINLDNIIRQREGMQGATQGEFPRTGIQTERVSRGATPPPNVSASGSVELPDPYGMAENTRARNKRTGDMYVIRGGKWVRQ